MVNFTSGINPAALIIVASLVALLPVLFGMTTCFLKAGLVLSALRSAFGIQGLPGHTGVLAVAVAVTFQVMAPVFEETARLAEALPGHELEKMSFSEIRSTLKPLIGPWREFMSKHAGLRERAVIASLAPPGHQAVQTEANQYLNDDNLRLVLPAFVLTELKEGFAMSFAVLLPFLAVDLIVANLLAGLGLLMVSPIMLSLPLKLILFVSSDGWLYLMKGLVNSYAV